MKKITSSYNSIKVVCVCGNSFVTKSTIGSEILKIEICSSCHPSFSKKHTIADIEGRVDKFRKKFGSLAK
jgi:large subunit ribosomal protein L31